MSILENVSPEYVRELEAEVERQELKLAEVNFSRDAWKARAEKAEAEIERLEKLIDYLEQYGPKPLNERLEQAEAEVERLRADLTQAQAEANVRGDRVVEYRERWQKAKERLAKVVERVRLAAGTLQLITDALSERCRKDLPHDHTMLRQARATLELLDAAAQPEEKRRG